MAGAFSLLRTEPELVPLAVEEGSDRVTVVNGDRIGNGDAGGFQRLLGLTGVLHFQRDAGVQFTGRRAIPVRGGFQEQDRPVQQKSVVDAILDGRR